MKKLFILLSILCMMTGSVTVYAKNYEWQESISYEETKTVTIPQPEGEIDSGWVYFTQLFTFVPEEDGTYRFLVSYDEDEANPYDIYMGVAPFRYTDDGSKEYLDYSGYLELKNGCEFDATAGIHYELCFQYPTHDGRYPEFTFYVGTAFDTQVPETGDTGLLLPAMLMLTAAAAVVWLTDHRRKHI